jgi:hypothetical protein
MAKISPPSPGEEITADDRMLTRFMIWTQRLTELFNGSEWIDVTFENGWGNIATTTYNKTQYRVIGNYLELRGRIGSVSGAIINTAAFTLPEGLRPALEYQFAVPSNNAFGKIRVKSNGDVVLQVGSISWAQIDGIRFSLD